MPPELPPKSPVTIQQIDPDTWLVKRQRPEAQTILVALERIEHLPDDPEWEETERKMCDYNNRNLPPFEE